MVGVLCHACFGVQGYADSHGCWGTYTSGRDSGPHVAGASGVLLTHAPRVFRLFRPREVANLPPPLARWAAAAGRWRGLRSALRALGVSAHANAHAHAHAALGPQGCPTLLSAALPMHAHARGMMHAYGALIPATR